MLRLADTRMVARTNPSESAIAINKARAALEALRTSLCAASLPTTERASIEEELPSLEAELRTLQADGERIDGLAKPN